MKKLLLITIVCSISAFAEKPLPEVCQKLINKSEEVFLVVEKQEPEKATQISKMRKILAGMKREWERLQKQEIKSDATEEEKIAFAAAKEESEQLFIKNCEQNLQAAEKALK